MAEQPTGTVTMLFTDIEGSTQLLERLGAERYREALELHRRLLRAAFERHGGYEVDSEGDAFFIAFADAHEALAAAADAQRALGEAEWPEREPIQVRMGIHTGEPLAAPPKYVGLDVHKTARIMAAGHGGQVVVSKATRDLLDNACELHNLGEHRLKDLATPQELFQLGRRNFPPLKTLYVSNLPVPATPFIGREGDLAEVSALLTDPGIRVLSLVGPGGVGKTRLALAAAAAVADEFPGGLTWIPLAAVRDPTLVIDVIAQALGIREQSGVPLLETVAGSLAGQSRLLLLDNAEQLLPALANDLARLSSASAGKLLVTSREPLQISAERVRAVSPLQNQDAVELFMARTEKAGVQVDAPELVSELCRRLDNLPLALELAAARTNLFTPAQLLTRLSERLDLLKGGPNVDARQATLRATIEWSYNLLAPPAQRLLRSLSVFAGGCTYPAAEEVCDADPDVMQALIEKSMVRRGENDLQPRYWMLETIREYAEEQLHNEEELEASEQRLAAWLTALLEAQPRTGAWDLEAVGQLYEEEQENVRHVLGQSIERADADTATRLVAQLGNVWMQRGDWHEGRAWAERILPLARLGLTLDSLRVVHWASVFATDQYDHRRAIELKLEAVGIAERLGSEASNLLASHHTDLGELFSLTGEPEVALCYHERAIELWRAMSKRGGLAHAINGRAATYLRAGQIGEAEADLEESIRLVKQAIQDEGEERIYEALYRNNLGEVRFVQGRDKEALSLFLSSLRTLVEHGHEPWAAIAMLGVAATHWDPRTALKLVGAADVLFEKTGYRLTPQEDTLRMKALDHAAESLSEPESQALLQAGRTLRPEAAFELALANALLEPVEA